MKKHHRQTPVGTRKVIGSIQIDKQENTKLQKTKKFNIRIRNSQNNRVQ